MTANTPVTVHSVTACCLPQSSDSMANDSETTNNTQLFEDRIQLLTDLYNRLDSLRQIPTTLLKPPAANDLPSPVPLRSEFETLKVIGETVRSEKVQEALRAARDSEKGDKSDLSSNFRRENRKRRYVRTLYTLDDSSFSIRIDDHLHPNLPSHMSLSNPKHPLCSRPTWMRPHLCK